MRIKKAPVTIQDVAKKANVSIKTVSRVINSEPNVSEKTIKKVQKAVDLLDYQPNAFAQSLARSQPKIISLIYNTPSPNYITHIMEGVLSYCYKQGFEVIIHPCRFDESSIIDDTKIFIKKSRVSGIITTPPLSDFPELIDQLDKLDIPKILVSSGLVVDEKEKINTNDYEASFAITNHLIKKGHKRIGFIKGNPSHLCVNQRFLGFFDAMKEANLPCEGEFIETGLNSFASGEVCARRLLSLKKRPSAIFAANDEMAAAVIKVANLLSIDVPDNLSVIGFDDTPMTEMISPALTTVHQPLFKMGESAANKLICILENKPYEGADTIASELVIRNSTANFLQAIK
tara:strand:- start:5144 stop:6178 length:1035 start_codon:yes stop_codon:yes gene_type:complete